MASGSTNVDPSARVRHTRTVYDYSDVPSEFCECYEPDFTFHRVATAQHYGRGWATTVVPWCWGFCRTIRPAVHHCSEIDTNCVSSYSVSHPGTSRSFPAFLRKVVQCGLVGQSWYDSDSCAQVPENFLGPGQPTVEPSYIKLIFMVPSLPAAPTVVEMSGPPLHN
jgi:hypothetical protein